MVKLPADIDGTCSENVAAELAAALGEGVRVLVADMSATRSCDTSGARMLMLAQRRAARRGARLRLLAPPATVLRTLKRLGVAQVVPVYSALTAAVADTLDPQPPPMTR